MAHSIAGAFSPKYRDELFTPKILVDPLEEYIQAFANTYKDSTGYDIKVWLPFDTEDSEYSYLMRYMGIKYEASHIWEGKDFFVYEPREWDIAISNPPFSVKLPVFKRLKSLGKPFAMLMNLMAVNYMEIGSFFADNPIQILGFDKRVSFDGNPSSFASGYICDRFLPSDCIFKHLPHCNSGKDFVPSRMNTQKSHTKFLSYTQEK